MDEMPKFADDTSSLTEKDTKLFEKFRDDLWTRAHVRRKRVLIPLITIGKNYMNVNRAAYENIGEDKKYVILFWSEPTRRVSFLFLQDKLYSPVPKDTYKITRYKEESGNTGKISAKAFVENYNLRKYADAVNKKSFILKKEEDGDNMFYVEIK